MPTLDWIGKKAVVRHHAEVPFHLLKEEPALSCGGEAGAGNLIVQGDNLKALKALLPHYAGQVKCVCIDPPYNTGNEGWVYNDNVNAPEIKKWLADVVGPEAAKVGKEGEDLTRHDKWLCMMYPRLMLLKQFLRDDGAIFVCIDDNEAATLKLLMDEIFGAANFIAQVIWQKVYSVKGSARFMSQMHDYVLVYARRHDRFTLNPLARTEKSDKLYKNLDGDPRGPWRSGPLAARNFYSLGTYPITCPSGRVIDGPPKGSYWRFSKAKFDELDRDGRIFWGKDGSNVPAPKLYLSEVKQGVVPSTIWLHTEAGHNQDAKRELLEIVDFESSEAVFITPKPTKLIQRILHMATDKDSLILDSFAGSGTTGHAVLKQNAEDGGTRRFILVEIEESIARPITAERVRRVSQGYCNEKGETVSGLGSGFRFATLGKTLFDETGAIRQDVKFTELAEFVFFHETGSPLPAEWKKNPLLGSVDGRAVYLLYNGILADKTPDGGNVLTAASLAALPPHTGEKIIYAAACRLGANRLDREGIRFKQTPYSIRVD